MEKVGGQCFVRDGIDIIPFTCGHYLRLGFSRLIFMDDRSSDGTFEFLKALSRRDPRVVVSRVDIRDTDHGQVLKSAAANELIDEGIRIVFPFDQDEFWNLRLDALRRAASAGNGIFAGSFVQFIQSRRQRVFGLLGPLRIRYRAPALANTPGGARQKGKPYLCYSKQKIGVKSDAPVVLGLGNHRLSEGSQDILAAGLEVFHLPLRSRLEIEKRASYTRHAHYYLRDKITDEARDAVWASASADNHGCLTSETGETIPLVPDARLRWILIRAFLYMALHHPVLLAKALWKAKRSKPFWREANPDGERPGPEVDALTRQEQ
jgi:hypothetical protein